MMGSTKNMIRGLILTAVYVTTTIIIPMLTFSVIRDVAGAYIVLSEEDYNKIIFWILAFGLVISGCAFFNYSSPKQSIRRGIFAFIQVIVNCLYIWSYKFSGATELIFTLEAGGISGFVGLKRYVLIW